MDVCALLAIELRAALGRGELSAVEALEAVLCRGRLQSDDNQVVERCKQWITRMRGQFTSTPIAPLAAPATPLNFRMA